MKKLTTLLLAIVLLCGTLWGCNQEDISGDESTENGKESETTQKQNVGLVEGILDDYDKEESQKGFTIKGKKYPYNDNDVLILEIENTTDTHYIATFKVTFYDEADKVVATQAKTIEQFSANYTQACAFQPECQFDSYTCELSLEEYTGPDYMSTLSCGKFTTKGIKVELPYDNPYMTHIYVNTYCRFGPCPIPSGMLIDFDCEAVVFDNTGNIYTIIDRCGFLFSAETVGTERTRSDALTLVEMDGLNQQIPEELTGELTVIEYPLSVKVRPRATKG